MWCASALLLAVCAAFAVEKSAPDMREEVQREGKENLQIHDVFKVLEDDDKKAESVIKRNRNLVALQIAPDVSAEVSREASQNIQIHDPFLDSETKDRQEENRIKHNRDLVALAQTSPHESVADAVNRDKAQNLQIHDDFGALEARDTKEERKVKADRNLTALRQASIGDDDAMSKYIAEMGGSTGTAVRIDPNNFSQDLTHTENAGGEVISVPLNSQLQESTSFLQKSRANSEARTAPGVEAKVAQEKMEDVYIHDQFHELEGSDAKVVAKVKGDPNLKAL